MNKRTTFVALSVSAIIPIAILLLSDQIGLEATQATYGVGALFMRVAEKTSFPNAANKYLITAFIFLPIQIGIIARYIVSLPLSRFQESIKRIESNELLFKIFSIQVGQKWGLGYCSALILAVLVFAQFGIGGDLSSCPGCETSNIFRFAAINFVATLSLWILAAIFIIWIRLRWFTKE